MFYTVTGLCKSVYSIIYVRFVHTSYYFTFFACLITLLTLQAVGVQQLLALLVHFDPALRTAHTLPGDAPQQALALVAVGGRSGRPDLKVVWRGAGDGVDQGLQGLLVHVQFLLD